MRQVPLDRARVRHRLQRAVLVAERCGEGQRGLARGEESPEQVVALAGRDSTRGVGGIQGAECPVRIDGAPDGRTVSFNALNRLTFPHARAPPIRYSPCPIAWTPIRTVRRQAASLRHGRQRPPGRPFQPTFFAKGTRFSVPVQSVKYLIPATATLASGIDCSAQVLDRGRGLEDVVRVVEQQRVAGRRQPDRLEEAREHLDQRPDFGLHSSAGERVHLGLRSTPNTRPRGTTAATTEAKLRPVPQPATMTTSACSRGRCRAIPPLAQRRRCEGRSRRRRLRCCGISRSIGGC